MSKSRQSEVKAIFLQASLQPEEKRRSFLDDACRGDSDLRREVESLLEHHQPETIITPPAGTGEPRPARVKRIGPRDRYETLGSPGDTRWSERLFGTRTRRAVATAIIVLLLLGVSLAVRTSTKNSLRQVISEKLATVLDADILALEIWIEERLDEAQLWAADPELRKVVSQLADSARANPGNDEALRASGALPEFYRILAPSLSLEKNLRVGLVNEAGIVIANPDDRNIGSRITAVGWKFMSEIFEGNRVFVRPNRPEDTVRNPPPPPSSSTSHAYTAACAPVRDADGRIVASLNLIQDADGRFTEIISVARMGQSGETYAFDKNGLILSESRFTAELRGMGLVPDEENSRSALHLQIRDPGKNLYRNPAPRVNPSTRPLTRLAAIAVASRLENDPARQRGILMHPYRDYRGVKVIGAWQWLPRHGFGVATEVDAAEAYAPLLKLDLALGSIFSLLALASGAYLISSFSVAQLQHEIGVARRLGSYTLMSRLGEGGMGEVYLARHTMLKRPTAIKVLKKDLATPDNLERFEREVQLASQLTHPNTVEIYDYGKTPEGIFYYVMEYIDGLDLARLVSDSGALPTGRAIFVLLQICASLKEAHQRSFIHRDIKPQNIMICIRGGEFDVIKVLDFGLVKNLEMPEGTPTAPAQVTGTPLYMAPERIRDNASVDARADIYSVGAVAYYLLSARHLFENVETLELLFHVASEPPLPLSDAADQSIPPDLEALVMQCLEKDPSRRPQDVNALIIALRHMQTEHPWPENEARTWWDTFRGSNR